MVEENIIPQNIEKGSVAARLFLVLAIVIAGAVFVRGVFLVNKNNNAAIVVIPEAYADNPHAPGGDSDGDGCDSDSSDDSC